MKILFFFNGDFQEGNAATARFVCYGKELNKQGIENCFYVIRPSEFGDSGINKESEGKVEGVNYKYLAKETKRRKRIVSRFFMLFKSWVSILKILKSNSPKQCVIYFYGPQLITHGAVLLLCRLFGYKVAVEQTELHSLKKESSPIKTAFSLLNNGFVEHTMPFWADKLFVTTGRLRRFYRLRFPALDTVLMRIVFDVNRFQGIPISLNAYRLGYLGSFQKKDGVEGILEAFSKLKFKSEFSDLKLRLIGFQTASFNLESELEKNNLIQYKDCIEATGQVEAHEIPKLLCGCDLLLMNRTSDSFANYGFPIKLGEYMATGIPVVCTNVSDISKYFSNNHDCLIIEPDSVLDLVNAIENRYNGYEHHNSIGVKGKERVMELFEGEKNVSFLLSELRLLLN